MPLTQLCLLVCLLDFSHQTATVRVCCLLLLEIGQKHCVVGSLGTAALEYISLQPIALVLLSAQATVHCSGLKGFICIGGPGCGLAV